MSFNVVQSSALDYAPVRYGASRLLFRGPKKQTDDDYVVVIGGTEVYGRFVARPFCDLVEDEVGCPVLNLGCQNAGLDAFLYDTDVVALAKGARLTVLQVVGAQNMSNRFYRVHSRRNDRFLGPSDGMKSVFQEVDFTDFSFVRHMLSTLQMISPDRFARLREELSQAWVARMRLMLRTIDGPVLLLWLRETSSNGLGAEPLFVGADMVHDVASEALGVVEVPVARAGGDREGMVFGPMESDMAAQMLSVQTHHMIASELSRAIRAHL